MQNWIRLIFIILWVFYSMVIISYAEDNKNTIDTIVDLIDFNNDLQPFYNVSLEDVYNEVKVVCKKVYNLGKYVFTPFSLISLLILIIFRITW